MGYLLDGVEHSFKLPESGSKVFVLAEGLEAAEHEISHILQAWMKRLYVQFLILPHIYSQTASICLYHCWQRD